MNRKVKPNRKTVRAAIRGSVPDGKLRKARILLSDIPHGKVPISGMTEFATDRKTVVKIGAPDGDNAFAITVRGHETRHATTQRLGRKKPMTEQAAQAAQIVDDVNVETMDLPIGFSGTGLEDYRRAHIATALNDVRNMLNAQRKIEKGLQAETWETRNIRLLKSIRAKAMLAHYRDGGTSETVRTAMKGSKKIRDLIGPDTSRAIHQIIQYAKNQRTRNKAISMLTLLLESGPENTSEPEFREGTPDDEGNPIFQLVEKPALEGNFRVVDLRPKSAYTAKERMITQKYAPDGVHLNPNRYIAAILTGDSNGLFSRRVRQKPGGTVVIDASGSMGATAENLTALAQRVPTATIAYYSGDDVGSGQLSIYAEKGKRFAGQLPSETLMGGNSVDLASVRWLFQHPKPWTLVSDLQFVGGPLGSELIAHALVERAVERGELTVYESLDAAFEAFGGKGELGDANPRTRDARKRRGEAAKAKHPTSFKKTKKWSTDAERMAAEEKHRKAEALKDMHAADASREAELF